MRATFLLFTFLTCLVLCAEGQEYGYTRYDSKDGLAGSTVYCLTQDKDGFMWLGTESGLSRFDGTHFKNFTQDDGLPDNEVIQLFADSKGRVWISPFKKSICYYYKGKIYTSKNDSALQHIQVKDNVVRFAEDVNGNILIQEISRLYLLQPNGKVSTILQIGAEPIHYISSISAKPGGGFWVIDDESLYLFNNNHFEFWKKLPKLVQHFCFVAVKGDALGYLSSGQTVGAMAIKTNKNVKFPYDHRKGHNNVAIIDDDHIATLSMNGAYVYDLNHPDTIQRFLQGVGVTNMFKDTEDNWWFSTFGKGIYRLNSASVYNLKITTNDGQEHPVFAFTRYKESILAGSDHELKQLSIET
jgi:ligand-binding sensor domain-containing protein